MERKRTPAQIFTDEKMRAGTKTKKKKEKRIPLSSLRKLADLDLESSNKGFQGKSLGKELKGLYLFGVSAIGALLMAGIIWSSTASLSGAVIAQGVVGVEGSRKTIQHLEGGIIADILVEEGDQVASGEILIILDDVRARARVEELENRVRMLAAEEARLRAERADLEEVYFDHVLLEDKNDPNVMAVIEQQLNQFETRKINLESRKSILSKRIDQLEDRIEGLNKQVIGTKEQLRLIREEITTVQELLEKGNATRPRLLALQRAEAELIAKEGDFMSNIAGVREAIGETELRIINLKTENMEEIDRLLSTAQTERISTEKLYWESYDELARTSVVSPVAGIILNLAFKTKGGVIGSGQPILDIVPLEDDLIINAKVRPQDIDELAEGMKAQIVFPAYQQRYLHRISGSVIYVSADALVDSQEQGSYFLAKIRVDQNDLREQIQEIELIPGMPAEVYITTKERTFFEYLFEPIFRTFQRAMRES